MKLSEAIESLTKLKDKYGDLDLAYIEPTSGGFVIFKDTAFDIMSLPHPEAPIEIIYLMPKEYLEEHPHLPNYVSKPALSLVKN